MTDFAEYQLLVDMQRRIAGLEKSVKQVLTLLQTVKATEENIMATAQEVLTAVSEETTVDQSIIALLDGIHQQLLDAQAQIAAGRADAAVLDQVMATVAGNKQAVVDAVTRNTQAPA